MKKEKMTKGEIFTSIGAGLLGIMVVILLINYIFINPPACNGIDEEYLVCALMPFNFINVLGLILFCLGIILLTFPLNLFGANWAFNYQKVSFYMALAGMLLIVLF